MVSCHARIASFPYTRLYDNIFYEIQNVELNTASALILHTEIEPLCGSFSVSIVGHQHIVLSIAAFEYCHDVPSLEVTIELQII